MPARRVGERRAKLGRPDRPIPARGRLTRHPPVRCSFGVGVVLTSIAVRVVREYTAQYADPIVVRRGDRVLVGADDPEFPGWWWCTGPDGRSGWVPDPLLQREGAEAIMLQDYTARELSVQAGAEVILHHALSGWAWVTTLDGRAGWIPQTCIGTE